MTRKKVKLAFITNDSARKATLKKRKKGLMKKASELSTLCGIDVCAIIYSPYENQPEVWPSMVGAQRVLAQFKRMPEMEQSKKMVNQESFIRQRIAKASEHLKKIYKENREKEITEVMYQCLTGKGIQNLILNDLNDLAWLLDQKLKEIYKRVESLKKANSGESPATAPVVSPTPAPAPVAAPPPEVVDLGQRPPQWFADWMMSNNNVVSNEPQLDFEHVGMMMPFNESSNNKNSSNNNNHHHHGIWHGGFFQ